MGSTKMRTFGRALAVLTAALTAMTGSYETGAAASAMVPRGYGPPPPGGGSPPGGFGNVIASLTISPDGLVVGPVDTGKARLAVTIPAGAFPAAVQVTLTSSGLPSPGRARLRGYTPVAGAGTQVQQNGLPFPGPFSRPLTADFRSPLITPSSIVLVWNGTKFVTDTAATVASGSATVSFETSSDFLVFSPARCRACRGEGGGGAGGGRGGAGGGRGRGGRGGTRAR
jgi:hypothetical protein